MKITAVSERFSLNKAIRNPKSKILYTIIKAGLRAGFTFSKKAHLLPVFIDFYPFLAQNRPFSKNFDTYACFYEIRFHTLAARFKNIQIDHLKLSNGH